MPFGIINRFAGDRMNDLKAGYSAFDNQIAGGLLPGGAEPDAAALVRDVAKDALPGKNSTSITRSLDTGATKGAGLTSDALAGNVSSVGARAHAGRAGSKIREHVVEEVVEKGVKELGGRGARRALGAAAFPLGMYDTINDAGAAYSAVLQHNTGKDLDAHIASARDVRDDRHSFNRGPVMPSDGSTPTIEQRDQPPIPGLQEAQARIDHLKENFNPLEGDWGMTEILYGR